MVLPPLKGEVPNGVRRRGCSSRSATPPSPFGAAPLTGGPFLPFRREFVLVLDTLVSTHGFGPYLGPGVFPHADFSPLRTALPPPPKIRAPPLDGIYEIRQKSVTNAYFRCKITTFFRSSGPRAPQGPIDNMRLPLDVAEIRMVMTMGEKKRRNKDVLALIRTNYCILSESQ